MLLIMVIFASAFILPFQALFAAFMTKICYATGLIRQRWAVLLVTTVGMIIIPAAIMISDDMARNKCFAARGPDDLSCAGELGGSLFAMLLMVLILESLILGPYLGDRLYARWTKKPRIY